MADAADRELEIILGKLDKLSAGTAQQALLVELARESLELVRQGFDVGRAPTGRSWRRPRDGGIPLQRTGRLRRSFTIGVKRGSFVLTSSAPYAAPLQSGARRSRGAGRRRGSSRTDPRPMVPERSLGKWQASFRRTAIRWMREYLGA